MKRYVMAFFLMVLVSACTKKSQFASITFEHEYNYGIIEVGDTVNHDFTIRNTSNIDLKIIKLGSSCGCTAAILVDSVIKPGEKGKIRVKFGATDEKIGPIKDAIVFRSNTNPPVNIMYLVGEVRS